MGRWLSVSFHLTWPLQGQIGHTVSRRSAADPAAPRRGGWLRRLPFFLQQGRSAALSAELVKSSYLG